ncbi:MAG: hypothetical protein ACREP2_09050 [Rhodanobacteraceae bacterium]
MKHRTVTIFTAAMFVLCNASAVSAQKKDVTAKNQSVSAQSTVQWEPVDTVAPWYMNQTLRDELQQSIREFFGNAVGTYFYKYGNKPFWGFSQDDNWQLISTQFIDIQGSVYQRRGTILHGQWQLYAWSNPSGPVDAIVTAIGSTSVVAAAIVHMSCGSISRSNIHDVAIVKNHFFVNPKCSKPVVTIFFKDAFAVDPAIRDVLAHWGSRQKIEDCKHDILHSNSLEHKAYVTKFGAVPSCWMHYKVKLLNREEQ